MQVYCYKLTNSWWQSWWVWFHLFFHNFILFNSIPVSLILTLWYIQFGLSNSIYRVYEVVLSDLWNWNCIFKECFKLKLGSTLKNFWWDFCNLNFFKVCDSLSKVIKVFDTLPSCVNLLTCLSLHCCTPNPPSLSTGPFLWLVAVKF